LRDANGNMVFDGGSEWIGFSDTAVLPALPRQADVVLRTFPEMLSDTAGAAAKKVSGVFRPSAAAAPAVAPGRYSLSVDTSDLKRRTQDLTEPITIHFGRKPAQGIHADKLFLSYDSAGTTVEAPLTLTADSGGMSYELHTPWQEDAVYALRLQKGFAQDSNGADLMPGRYNFRTKRDEDYGKLRVHLPGKFYGPKHVLQVVNEHDTVYQQPVLDTMVSLLRLPPGVYTLRVIGDENENGRWDVGDLFLRRQPELVTPYNQLINLKAGWEQQVDFEEKERKRGF